jgi:hypothetical protein
VLKHGFVLFAKPLLTPTTPKACPFGKVLLHCGQEMSFPRGAAGVAVFLAARAAPPLKIKTEQVVVIDKNLKINLIIYLV